MFYLKSEAKAKTKKEKSSTSGSRNKKNAKDIKEKKERGVDQTKKPFQEDADRDSDIEGGKAVDSQNTSPEEEDWGIIQPDLGF